MSQLCATLSFRHHHHCSHFSDIFQAHQTMQQVMWQPNMLQVAKFLDAGMKRLQAVDPDEGSNI